MKFVTHQHRFGLDIIHSDERLSALWNDIEITLNGLTDERIIDEYMLSENAMSISNAINNLIDKGVDPQNESLRDSFIDLLNYSAIAIMVLENKWPSE